MRLLEILDKNAVKSLAMEMTAKLLFQELGRLAQSAYGIESNKACSALKERENDVPTALGQGLALPHARLHGMDRLVGLFVRLERPVEFDSPDRRRVDLVFGLLAPQNPGDEYLKTLARIARTLSDTRIQEKLRSTSNPVLLHAILTEETATAAV